MLPLSLSYDHRVVDGAAGARFITYLGQVLTGMRESLQSEFPARKKKSPPKRKAPKPAGKKSKAAGKKKKR
jgi:hypothetical protein